MATRGLSAVGVVVVVAGTLLLATPAQAITIFSYGAAPSTAQAGAHPDFAIEFSLSNHQESSEEDPCDCRDAKNIDTHLPAGFIGNPHAAAQCAIAEFASDSCPVDSQVALATVLLPIQPGSPPLQLNFLAPVYNLVPPPSEPGLLGFKSPLLDTPTFEDVSARTATDYGLDVDVTSIEHFFPLERFGQVTWGVPAAPIHDDLRFPFGVTAASTPRLCNGSEERAPTSAVEPADADSLLEATRLCGADPAIGEFEGFEPVRSQSPEEPFIQNPTTCGDTSLETSIEVTSYDGSTADAESPWPPTTNCNELTFDPSQFIAPTTTEADSPSGAEFRLTVPQFESPSVPSPSELREANVTLPQGFSLAPNVTNGKVTCSEAEALMGHYASTAEGHCPEDSKIGTISVATPVLPGLLTGAVYLGESLPGDRFRLFLVFDGFGVHVKLPGTVTPDPDTGQIHIHFQDLPQAPFAEFNMHIFGSERGPLDTPTQCGTDEVTSVFSPWDSALPSDTSTQFFEVSSGPNGTPCPNGAAPFGPPRPRPFAPAFRAASAANTAGAHTAFSIDLAREDGQQNLSALRVTTPPGFSATLKGVSYCPQAQIEAAGSQSLTGTAELASPSCPASSLLGESTAAAGPGTHPLYLPGKVYLAGPYKGAPLSLVVITPAVSGGYDLGNVLVREGLDINPETAQVTTVGAPLPQIFEGIPLRLRQLMVNLNRPGFALNPTNCDPFSVSAQVFGNEGAVSNASTHFQVANCASLSFAPKLSMGFSGSTVRAGNPAVHAQLSYPSGGSYANVSRVAVTLPPTELVDNAHINDPCTKVQFFAGNVPGEKCPSGSVIGFAKASTPLLEKPLEGPVYLRTGGGHKLPDIVAALNGQIDIALDGHVDQVKGGIRTTFETVPDAPVSNFSLTLDGGSKGLLQNNTNLCKHPLHVSADIAGQNGKTANQNPVLSTPCGKKHKRKGHKRHLQHRKEVR